ncbi:MAG: sugar kinase [Chitinophagaceae bacterium]|nr:sugar kinase [Chitinophagaceae bacterium]
MKKICCFGELLMRMSPDAQGKWIGNASMPVYLGGAELNVAHALATWKLPVRYFTALPENNLSRNIQQQLTINGLDTSLINFSGKRTGIYYLTQGADLKHADVIYDRADSSFASLKTGTLDWDMILQDVDWFHFSAISPALSQQAADVCLEAVRAAAKKDITISIDLNYRSKLWKYNKDPKEVMRPFIGYCDVVMGNIWSANTLLGIPVDENIHAKNNRQSYLDHASQTAKDLMELSPECKVVANTFRFDKDNYINYYAAINDRSEQYVSVEFNTDKIIDKVGSGDCFMAGLIYGIKKALPFKQTVSYAAAAAFGKLMEHGDATKNTPDQIISILNIYGK